jgi:tRNA threonylcarbamoyladenosine biosynthesis protein TsaB
MLCDPGELASLWGRGVPAVIAGTGVHLLPERLREAATVIVAQAANRARALLALAQQRHHDGAAVDAVFALPLYLRDKVALTTQERADRRHAAEAAT